MGNPGIFLEAHRAYCWLTPSCEVVSWANGGLEVLEGVRGDFLRGTQGVLLVDSFL